jgi:hypothetical protein
MAIRAWDCASSVMPPECDRPRPLARRVGPGRAFNHLMVRKRILPTIELHSASRGAGDRGLSAYGSGCPVYVAAWKGPELSSRWYRSSSKTGAENRKTARAPIGYGARLRTADGIKSLGSCTILDISEGGAKLLIEGVPADIPDEFILVLSSQAQTFRRCLVRWRTARQIGVQFLRR